MKVPRIWVVLDLPVDVEVTLVITSSFKVGPKYKTRRQVTSSQTLFSLPANKNVQMDRKVQDFAEET